MFDKSDLTLYRIAADNADVLQALFGADDLLVLGRVAADEQTKELFERPDVLTVTCEPLEWGSDVEDDVVSEAYFNGMDLGAPLLPLAEKAGLDVDPETFDPVALLDALRKLTGLTTYQRQQLKKLTDDGWSIVAIRHLHDDRNPWASLDMRGPSGQDYLTALPASKADENHLTQAA